MSVDFVGGVVLKCSTNNIKKLKCSDYRPTAAAPSEANSISQKHLTVAQQVAGQPPFENIQEILQHFTLRSHVQEKESDYIFNIPIHLILFVMLV